MSPERALKIVLRLIGSSSLFALIFVAAPQSWMVSIHSALGLGTLPTEPIVGYLARSLSAFYAILGGLFWVISFDVPRYRQLLIYLGFAIVVLGVALLAIDWYEGLPYFWTFWEGPFVFAFGLAVLFFGRNVNSSPRVG